MWRMNGECFEVPNNDFCAKFALPSFLQLLVQLMAPKPRPERVCCARSSEKIESVAPHLMPLFYLHSHTFGARELNAEC